ncbi:hypothetical protein DUNSADRAFT_14174 [Dunaliella salina]|uniref:Uncharacterized protein n=1 Tax=Dunaliella salina TaxID=3046 RepID=A0ABQ7H2T8_DUNSA|nr:hypothetical protein DUNSADRAFT_14174 [Dunaliella salina]|eukprot:KAF5841171.1 hypothetical protein DUNSADRAFT_14174 [Dunaliella salina]
MARKVGDLERKNKTLVRKPEDEYWGEEAGRRFVVQQEELVLVHEENMRLKKQLAQGGKGAGGAAAAEENAALASQIEELTSLVRFYEKKVSTMSERLAVGGGAGSAGPGPDDWVLQDLSHDGSLYLVDPKTNKMFTVPSGSNSYPRPVGMRLPSGIKLGSNSRMDRFICTLDSYCQVIKHGIVYYGKWAKVLRTFDDGNGPGGLS